MATLALLVRHPLEVRESPHSCQCQRDKREDRLKELTNELRIAERRKAVFRNALNDPRSSYFASAREGIRTEETLRQEVEDKINGLDIQTPREFLPQLVVSIVSIGVLAFGIARLAVEHARRVGLQVLPFPTWRYPYLGWLLVFFVPHQLREVYTSVLCHDEKSWYGWTSFCVSPLAWASLWMVALGIAMMIAYPTTLLWRVSRLADQDRSLNPKAADGAWGIGSLVLFIQTWSLLAIFVVVFPLGVWIKLTLETAKGRLSWPYLIPGIAVSLATLVLSGRLIRGAIWLRLALEKRRAQLLREGHAVRGLPPDPTISILGTHWWSLPATLLGSLGAVWAIIQWSGAVDLLRGRAG